MRTRGSIIVIACVALAAVLCVGVVAIASQSGTTQKRTTTRSHAGAVLRDSTTGHRTGHTAMMSDRSGGSEQSHRGKSSTQAHHPAERSSKPNPVALSVFAGGGAVTTVRAAGTTLDNAVSGAFDYVPNSSWATISSPLWMVEAWGGQGLKLTLAVPMLTRSGTDLSTCARGAYSQYFAALARTLVLGGLDKATLAIGWEPETGAYPWHVHNGREARAYVGCWRRIHNAIASTSGAHFTYLWDAGDPPPTGDVPLQRLYPGNRYVNVITTSALDTPAPHTPPARQWPEQAGWRYGADWAAGFAALHHKRIALFMLDLGHRDNGDNGTYVTEVLRWASRHHALSITVWDYGSGALLTGHFPAVTKALKKAAAAGYLQVTGRGQVGG